jgi:hypothetical protein
MHYGGMKSWQIGVGGAEPFLLGALWIRDVEHIEVPPDPTVPGPLDTDSLPAPSAAAVPGLGDEWLAWWRSIVDMSKRPPLSPPDLHTEPAHDTPDPLGLARLPLMRKLVAQRWPEHLRWNTERNLDPLNRRTHPNPRTSEVVREIEAELGRKVRPFNVRFLLLPVRDDQIRQVEKFRYLVPERIYDGPQWPGWLRELVLRIG